MKKRIFFGLILLLMLLVLAAGSPSASRWARDLLPTAHSEVNLVASRVDTSSPTTAQWLIDTVDTSHDFGAHASVAIDPRDDIPYVSYYDATNGDLRLASPVESGAGNCGSDNSWSCRTVDNSDNVGVYSSISI